MGAEPEFASSLFIRMNAGDQGARDELLKRACGRLERLAHRMTQDFPRVRRWEDTDDVLQNALVRLLRTLATVKVDSARDFFRLAALQIRRELLDLARSYYGPLGMGANQASAANLPQGQSTPPPPVDRSSSTLDPANLAAWTEFHRQVDSLPEPAREVFDLIWYQELSQAEAADILNVATITVKRRWLSARIHLQAFLDSAKNSAAQ